jgi:hypothetical protein
MHHPVCRVECGDVPWDLCSDGADELGHLRQFFDSVVETGDDQGRDLDPYAKCVVEADRIEDRLQAPG